MKYPNKRMVVRSSNGQFKKLTFADVGIGVCEKCQHLMVRHYDGRPDDPHPDPRLFKMRCFNCTPLTDEERAVLDEIEAKKPKSRGLAGMIEDAARSVGLPLSGEKEN